MMTAILIALLGALAGFYVVLAWCTLGNMNHETEIELSGPVSVKDGRGRPHDITAIRIFNEGYGVIDVHVDFAKPMPDGNLYEDPVLIAQILARLRALGYSGPDFGLSDLGLQDDTMIVLEAPEAFNAFAASKGWKNLAEEFENFEESSDDHAPEERAASASARPKEARGSQKALENNPLLTALMRKYNTH